MSAVNPHKKGEHVFNDIAGSLENALASVLAADRVRSIALAGRFGPLRMSELHQTQLKLNRFQRDPILTQARTLVAPATGLHDDPNSVSYSLSRLALEKSLADVIEQTGMLIWKKRPAHDSSFSAFNSIVVGMETVTFLKGGSIRAFDRLVIAAHDPAAEASALSERTSATELKRRRDLVETMKGHFPVLKQNGQTLISTFVHEVEGVLENRIAEP